MATNLNLVLRVSILIDIFFDLIIGKIMSATLLALLKTIAPLVIQLLREAAQNTDNKIDDISVDTVEFIMKKIGILK